MVNGKELTKSLQKGTFAGQLIINLDIHLWKLCDKIVNLNIKGINLDSIAKGLCQQYRIIKDSF